MRFLVDAQLPKSLALLISAAGYNAIHTLDLPQKNRTPDNLISDISSEEGRIVITKDSDFLDSHLLLQKPKQLVHITTGNIRNADLLQIFATHLPAIVEMLGQSDLLEITQTEIIGGKAKK